MKTKNDRYFGWLVTAGAEKYNETRGAQPTSRVLAGSADHGYAAEYVGYGDIDGIPVKAIYLFGDDQLEGDPDWDKALAQGRIIVDIDALSEAQWDTLQKSSAAVILGRNGGRAKTKRKAKASRANGRKGGRPKLKVKK